MVQFRANLILTLVAKGHRVTAVVPDAGSYRAQLTALGAEVVEISMTRFATVTADIVFVLKLALFFSKRRFDVVHTITLKPNLYAPPLARLFGSVRIVSLVSGAGYLFGQQGAQERPFLSKLIKLLLAGSFCCVDKVWFQNSDDQSAFIAGRLIPRRKTVVIRGSGVSMQEYHPHRGDRRSREAKLQQLGLATNTRLVLMVSARRIRAKGIREFCMAANSLAVAHPNWRFVLVAPEDRGTPDLLPITDPVFSAKSLILLSDFRTDVADLISCADIVTLPSYYPEGVPRFLLEGMACGKPIVTTDQPGCRETVINGVNGYIVPARDPNNLAAAFDKLMTSDTLRARFGSASREFCEQHFSDHVVCSRVLAELYHLP